MVKGIRISAAPEFTVGDDLHPGVFLQPHRIADGGVLDLGQRHVATDLCRLLPNSAAFQHSAAPALRTKPTWSKRVEETMRAPCAAS